MIIDGHETFDFDQKIKLANCFIFEDISLKLASTISESQTKFEQCLNPYQTFLNEANLDDDGLEETSKSWKPNKRKKETCDMFFTPLIYFQSFVRRGNFSRKYKNLEDVSSL